MKNLNALLRLDNRASDEDVYENIIDGVNLDTGNLIILMCAILIASVGLNMNATAVIIGAMLISPLMGAIIGIGFGIGTYDLKLIQRSFKLLLIEIIISIITATIYFLITPITAPGNELIARTTPTIWDVIIAFSGGIAGMVGLTRNKPGNVIPGVAIATALMPPLCTAGYGIATLQFKMFLGASYLFFINSFFIAISTFIMVKFFKIPPKLHIDKAAGLKLRRNIIILTILVTIPSLISAANMINQTVVESNLKSFISKEFNSDEYVISYKINEENKTIDVALVGRILSKDEIENLNKKLPSYGFDDMSLKISQDKELDIKDYLNELKDNSSDFIKDPDITVESIKNKEKENFKNEVYSIYNEIKSIFPEIDTISLTKGLSVSENKIENEENTEVNENVEEKENYKEVFIAIIKTKDKNLQKNKDKIINWLKTKTNCDDVKIFFQIEK